MAPAPRDPSIEAANEAAFAFPILSARVPASAIWPTSESVISPAPVTTNPWSARTATKVAEESTEGNSAYTPAPAARTTRRTRRLSNRSPAHASGTTAAVCASVNPVVYIPMTKPAETVTPSTVTACGSKALMYVGRSVSSVMKPNPSANRVRYSAQNCDRFGPSVALLTRVCGPVIQKRLRFEGRGRTLDGSPGRTAAATARRRTCPAGRGRSPGPTTPGAWPRTRSPPRPPRARSPCPARTAPRTARRPRCRTPSGPPRG